MAIHGQLQPVIARLSLEGYQIIDGFKRFYSSKNLGMESLQCRILDIDLPQAKVLLLSYNRPHQSMDAWEEALVLHDLMATHHLDQVTLAEVTGYSRTWVSRRLSLIEKMEPDLSGNIMMGTLTSSHARIHGTTKQRPLDLHVQEHAHLQPLPAWHYDTSHVENLVVNQESCVYWKGYMYVVPPKYMFDICPVRITDESVIIYSHHLGNYTAAESAYIEKFTYDAIHVVSPYIFPYPAFHYIRI